MGALVKNVCYSSQTEAVDAFYSGASAPVVSGDVTYVTQFTKVSGVWKSQGFTVDGAGKWSLRYQTDAPIPTFPECDAAAGLKDGLVVGWLVATAMILAAALVNLKRAAR